MADYYPLIAKAVTGLERSTGEARRELYDRARKALLAQLRGVEPPLSEPDITRERLALEEAIRKVEAEAARRSRNDPLPTRPEPPRPAEANGPETLAAESSQPNTKTRSEPAPATRVGGGQQADSAELRTAPQIRAASVGRPAAPLSAAAVKPVVPSAEGEDDGDPAEIAEADSAKPARPERSRWTPGGGPSLSDRGLKGFRNIFGGADTAGDAAVPAEAARDRAAPNSGFEITERAGDARPEKRLEKLSEPRLARRRDEPPDPRGDGRADRRAGPRAAPRPDNWTDARAETRANGRAETRIEPQWEPRAEPPRAPSRVEGGLGVSPRGDMRAEPRLEPEAPVPSTRRPSPSDAEKLVGREPTAELLRGREPHEGKRLREAERPHRPPEPPPEEPLEEQEPAGWNEYPTHAPSSTVRQEDMRRRAGATSRAPKPDRPPPAKRRATPRLPGQWRKLAALTIMGLLLVTVTAVGLWKAPELLRAIRGVPRTPDSSVPADSAGRGKITDRIGTATLQSVGDSAPVAQKVVLYEEDQSDPTGKRYVGSAVWRTDRVAPAPGKPPEVAVRADIEIPELRVGLRWSLRRNDDKALPASHTVEIMFTVPADFRHGSISNIPGVLMKQGESARGVPLAGLAVKVTNNFFLIGLSSVDADMQRNIQLLKERSWFDIPVVYGDGKRAIIAIEKGTPGERAFSDAFADWGQ